MVRERNEEKERARSNRQPEGIVVTFSLLDADKLCVSGAFGRPCQAAHMVYPGLRFLCIVMKSIRARRCAGCVGCARRGSSSAVSRDRDADPLRGRRAGSRSLSHRWSNEMPPARQGTFFLGTLFSDIDAEKGTAQLLDLSRPLWRLPTNGNPSRRWSRNLTHTQISA